MFLSFLASLFLCFFVPYFCHFFVCLFLFSLVLCFFVSLFLLLLCFCVSLFLFSLFLCFFASLLLCLAVWFLVVGVVFVGCCSIAKQPIPGGVLLEFLLFQLNGGSLLGAGNCLGGHLPNLPSYPKNN